VDEISSVASRIRETRESRGLTQASLAAQLGVTRSQVTLWETGGRNPSPNSLKELAQALQVDLEWLVKGKGSSRPIRQLKEGLDPELLQLVVDAVLSAFQKRGLDIHSRRFTQVVVLVYTATVVLWAGSSSKDVGQFREQLEGAAELALGA
jgi:transcriptional regulator with XRE-family HTH domain